MPGKIRRVVGVDVSQEMVNFASKHFEHNLIEYRQMDISCTANPRQLYPDGFTKVFRYLFVKIPLRFFHCNVPLGSLRQDILIGILLVLDMLWFLVLSRNLLEMCTLSIIT